ncbi:GDP-mannose 4,6-dehydratase [Cytobacillus suaedae]|nr:GDP-mannose 4,6-dehydratase [Cytobacillus suaedae]
MNVLVTGGYGFIGSFVAEKFYREGHKVFILDNLSTGNKQNVAFRHKYAILDVDNDGCEEIFRINKFDVVIHLAAQVDVKTSLENPVWDTKTNVYGLTNMLNLSAKYHVQKFIFASSAAVYGLNETIPLDEQSACDPISPYGLNKWIGESYCKKWMDMYHLNTLCFRFSNVYGPRQGVSGEGGVVSSFITRLLDNKPLHVYGDGTQTRDFIYVEDIAEGIYQSVVNDLSGIYNLSSNEQTSVNEMIEALGEITKVTDIEYKDSRPGDIKHSRLDNSNVLQQLDWKLKYTLREGLAKTYNWFVENETNKPNESTIKDGYLIQLLRILKVYLPFIENVFLFILTVLIELAAQHAFETIDFKILYILFIGIWLGKNQSILASGLTIILYTHNQLLNGREIISLLIDEETLLNFSIYIFLGIVSGYVVDRKKAKEQATRRELVALQGKYSFLSEIYHETRKMKDELQTQIINSEDSIGKIYSVVKRLDSLEKEQIYAEAITVLEKILKTNSVAIYIPGQNGPFLRLISNSKNLNQLIPRSIRSDESPELKQVCTTHQIFINKELCSDVPMIMAPIVKDEKVIALICLYDVEFNQLTLNYKNQLKVVVDLISVSLARAYEYVRATNGERYIRGTVILEPGHFSSILNYKKKMKEDLGIEYTVLELPWTPDFKRNILQLERSLRETDYIGMDEHGYTYLLFSNTSDIEAEKVIQRLHEQGIPVKKITRENVYE